MTNLPSDVSDSKTLDISSTREISIGSQAPSHTSPTKSARRGRPPKQRGTQTTTEHPPRPNTLHLVRTDSLHLNGASSEQEDLDDELLLLPTVVRSNKPVTPTPGSSQAGTPRYVLDFVEIVTPSKLQRNFPSPSLHTHHAPRPSRTSPTPSRSFPAQPTTSTRRSRKPPSRSPQKVPSGIRLNSLPVQIDNSSGVISPRRAQKNSIPFPHMSPIRQNTSLSGHLRHYLIAQKRATLRKLQKLPVSLEEHANEDGQPQANAVAYAQLSDLLLGTVSRGEGNSCILTGPRGSGKTQVRPRCNSRSTN